MTKVCLIKFACLKDLKYSNDFNEFSNWGRLPIDGATGKRLHLNRFASYPFQSCTISKTENWNQFTLKNLHRTRLNNIVHICTGKVTDQDILAPDHSPDLRRPWWSLVFCNSWKTVNLRPASCWLRRGSKRIGDFDKSY